MLVFSIKLYWFYIKFWLNEKYYLIICIMLSIYNDIVYYMANNLSYSKSCIVNNIKITIYVLILHTRIWTEGASKTTCI